MQTSKAPIKYTTDENGWEYAELNFGFINPLEVAIRIIPDNVDGGYTYSVRAKETTAIGPVTWSIYRLTPISKVRARKRIRAIIDEWQSTGRAPRPVKAEHGCGESA